MTMEKTLKMGFPLQGEKLKLPKVKLNYLKNLLSNIFVEANALGYSTLQHPQKTSSSRSSFFMS